jgi:hypothetical protein
MAAATASVRVAARLACRRRVGWSFMLDLL